MAAGLPTMPSFRRSAATLWLDSRSSAMTIAMSVWRNAIMFEGSASVPNEVPLQPLLVGDGVVVEAAAHAQLVVAYRIDPVRLHNDGATGARADADRAADGA